MRDDRWNVLAQFKMKFFKGYQMGNGFIMTSESYSENDW